VITEIDVDELATLIEGGATVIDVRMPDEYVEAHVPGAVLVPLPELPERLGDVPDEATAYVICKVGGRSMKACEFLESQGYQVVNVAGGTDAWIASGRDTVSGTERG
jgi:rhodanese-related sulfurtransferase